MKVIGQIECRFQFSAAHKLELGTKCDNMHGHNYTATVIVHGQTGGNGVIADYHYIERVWQECCGHLDHSLLNDHMRHPTAEHIAQHCLELLRARIPVFAVAIQENDRLTARVFA